MWFHVLIKICFILKKTTTTNLSSESLSSLKYAVSDRAGTRVSLLQLLAC